MAFTPGTTKSPMVPDRRSPLFLIASMCSGHWSTTVTSCPAFVRKPPTTEPIAPAPRMPMRLITCSSTEEHVIKRIGILGAGAIGSVVGGFLTKAGHDVTVVDQWPEHIEAIKNKGLRLSGTIGDFVVPGVKAIHIHELQSVREPF